MVLRGGESIQRGDAVPLLAMRSHAENVTYCAPTGEIVRGWAEMDAYWQRAAAICAERAQHVPTAEGEIVMGSRSVTSEEIVVAVTGEIGCVVARETVRRADGSVVLAARATNLYRREDGGSWHLFHQCQPVASPRAEIHIDGDADGQQRNTQQQQVIEIPHTHLTFGGQLATDGNQCS
jgi:ketosteroid isomerase-like protein